MNFTFTFVADFKDLDFTFNFVVNFKNLKLFVLKHILCYYLIRSNRGPQPIANFALLGVPHNQVIPCALSTERVHPARIVPSRVHQVGPAPFKLTSGLKD